VACLGNDGIPVTAADVSVNAEANVVWHIRLTQLHHRIQSILPGVQHQHFFPYAIA
jgi:hypothetical protein